MKRIFNVHWSAQRQIEFFGASTAVALTLFCSSCSKNKSTSASSAPAPTPAPVSSAAAPTTSSLASTHPPATATHAMPDLRPLNHALLVWIVHNRRHPASFEEFAASAGIQIPAPPPGKKYIIDSSGLISLEKR